MLSPDRIALVFEEDEYSAARLPSGKVLRRVLKERYGRASDG
jgi:hypothetical protein